ncbi:hypothetical protein MTO96_045300 [Rhipicephalus appendiculatus]
MVLLEKIGQGLPELMRRSHLASRLSVTLVEILQRGSREFAQSIHRVFHRGPWSFTASSRYSRTRNFPSLTPCPKTVLRCRHRKPVGASPSDAAAENRTLAPATASKLNELDVACPDAASQSDEILVMAPVKISPRLVGGSAFLATWAAFF